MKQTKEYSKIVKNIKSDKLNKSQMINWGLNWKHKTINILMAA